MQEVAQIPRDTIAAHIIELSNAVAKFSNNTGGLNRNALIALLHDSSGVSKRDIKFILDHIEQLQRAYCRR